MAKSTLLLIACIAWLLFACSLSLLFLRIYNGLQPDRRLLDMCELVRDAYPNDGGGDLDCSD